MAHLLVIWSKKIFDHVNIPNHDFQDQNIIAIRILNPKVKVILMASLVRNILKSTIYFEDRYGWWHCLHFAATTWSVKKIHELFVSTGDKDWDLLLMPWIDQCSSFLWQYHYRANIQHLLARLTNKNQLVFQTTLEWNLPFLYWSLW